MGSLFDAVKLLVLRFSFACFKVFDRKNRGTISWVVGVEEIASVVKHLSESIPGSHSVSLFKHPFYDHQYDTVALTADGSRFAGIERLILRPIALARLANRAQGFIYVGRRGFLGLSGGSRSAEFRFLKKHGLAICCYFTGNDIRAPKLLHELEAKTGIPNIASNMASLGEGYDSQGYDRAKQKIAAEADEFADVIFSVAVDQSSYIKKPIEPFLYFLPDYRFVETTTKFVHPERIRILHAPSQPLIKGTPQVREAIEKLKALGYEFEYIELSGVTHDVVTEQLRTAHIVLNQFYAFMPGVFGIESLAARCAVLMSADATIETDLPEGANDAWMVTRIDAIFDNLKRLLDNPQLLEPLASTGHDWAKANCSASASRSRLGAILDSVIDGTYTGRAA